jgi:EAL domain-containing protein (putative c-di-GMP-specific phosphodiesterase class I)
MPRVVVERHEGSLIDRYRPYIIFIDGQERGAVRNCETWQYEVPAGSHTLTVHVGHYCSPPIKLFVAGDTRIICHSNVAAAFGLLGLTTPESWITVREESDTAAATSPSPQEAHTASSKEAAEVQQALVRDLPDAVAGDAISLIFQPVIDLSSGRLGAVDASARWVHPLHGNIPAERFLSIAESLGLTGALSRRLLRQALVAASSWPLEIPVALLLSRDQLSSSVLIPNLTAVLQECNLPPTRVMLQVLVHVAGGADDILAHNAGSLRLLGVRLGLRDVGKADYVAAGLPGGVPYDGVVLSSSFGDAMTDADLRRQVIDPIIAVCHSQHIPCVASGIVTQEQLAGALSAGCTHAEGIALAPELPLEKVHAFLTRYYAVHAGAGSGVRAPPSLATAT